MIDLIDKLNKYGISTAFIVLLVGSIFWLLKLLFPYFVREQKRELQSEILKSISEKLDSINENIRVIKHDNKTTNNHINIIINKINEICKKIKIQPIYEDNILDIYDKRK